MANEVTFIVKVEGKNVSIVQKQTDKLAKSTEKVDKAQKKATQSGNKFHKLQKGVGQLGANNTKNFSKMNQTLGGGGGSSGLVAAYATLAANVFAATAAFGALQRAAEFENLRTGLHELGQQSGRTLSILAEGLRDVTGGALSAEEAMRGAAVGISGGFGGAELEGLAKIAKGAAITLGRNLPDAFDRLTRGAIKLEPEILDELGIMVRVDEAAENYAATIGKTANSLTMMEKRQAFMNAILEQGESKFGEIAEAVDPDPYTKLAATFADLTKGIFSFINETLMLGNVAEFLSENITILAGVMVLFGSTIAAKMLPFLADGAAAAHAQAVKMQALAEATLEAGKAQKAMGISRLGQAGGANLSKEYRSMAQAAQEAGLEVGQLETMQKSVNASLGRANSLKIQGKNLGSAANKQAIIELELEKAQIEQLMLLERGRGAEQLAFQKARSAALFAEAGANAISGYTAGVISLNGAFKEINVAYGAYVARVSKATLAQMGHNASLTLSQKAMIHLGAATKWVGLQFRLLGAAIMKAIVPIAIITIAIGAAVAIWDMFWNTKAQKKYNDGMEELDTLLEEIEEKVSKMNKAMNNTKDLADGQNRAFAIQSGLITELADKMRDLIKLRKEASGSRPGEDESDVQGAGWIMRKSNMFNEFFGAPTQDVRQFKGDLGVTGQEAGFEGLLALHDSPEVKALKGILTSEIPGAAKMMDNKLKTILKNPFESAEDSAKSYARAVREVEAAYGNLGPASKGLRESFKELEKESSKFLSTFAKKTSVDALVRGFEAADKAFNEFKTTVKEDASIAEWQEVVGTAMLDIGSKTASILGPAFVEAQKDVRRVTTEVDKLAVKTGKSLFQLREEENEIVKELDAALLNLKDQEPAYRKISAEVKQVQRLEMARKDIIDSINKSMKFMTKHYKMSVDLAGKSNKLLKQRLFMEKELAKSKHDLLKNTFLEMKVMKRVYVVPKGAKANQGEWVTEVARTVSITEFLNLSYAEQNELIEKVGMSQEQLNALRKGEYDLALRMLELEKVTSQQTQSALLQEAEARLHLIELEGKLEKGLIKRQETEQKISNFRTRGTTDMDAGDKAKQTVNAAIQEHAFAKRKAEQEKNIIKAKGEMLKLEFDLLEGQILLQNTMTRNLLNENRAAKGEKALTQEQWDASGHKIAAIDTDTIQRMKGAVDTITNLQTNAVDQNVNQLAANVQVAVIQGLQAVTEAIKSDEIDLGKAIRDQIILKNTDVPIRFKLDETGAVTDEVQDDKGTIDAIAAQSNMTIASGIMHSFKNDLAEISEEGGGIAQLIGGMDMIAQSFVNIKEGGDKLENIKGILTGVGQAIQGQAKAAAAAIDQQIKAEEKRDGKSKESVQKIKQLEMKKYQIQKKAFEQNKKISLANAIVSGAQAIQNAFKMDPWPLGLAMGILATGMTMMQIKAIKNTTFGGTAPDMGASASNTALSIGKRSSNIDVSRGATGGELGYLRGQRGYGTSASNWKPTGGAAGLRKGYASGGDILVGETGPEVITADEMGYNVIPNDKLGGGVSNVSFTINAVDAAGVEDVLLRQRGNIIGMIRQAANDTGERFLESVDTDVVGGG